MYKDDHTQSTEANLLKDETIYCTRSIGVPVTVRHFNHNAVFKCKERKKNHKKIYLSKFKSEHGTEGNQMLFITANQVFEIGIPSCYRCDFV